MFDDIHHPDLVEIDRHLTIRLDAVLEAEQEAAAVSARRALTLRDRLILAENQSSTVSVTTYTGVVTGRIEAVSADHVELSCASSGHLIPLRSILSVRI